MHEQGGYKSKGLVWRLKSLKKKKKIAPNPEDLSTESLKYIKILLLIRLLYLKP